MQFFKRGDETEEKYYNSGLVISETLSVQKDLFFDECFACFIFGETLYDNNFAPLSNAIPRTIFRETFATLFDSFLLAGSFESYLYVFKAVFGDDVVVEFTVPAPGRLQIDIEAAGAELSNFVARRVVDNAYVFDEIIDWDGDNIVFQSVKGFETEYELNQMLFEMVPSGIFTEITLTVGS